MNNSIYPGYSNTVGISKNINDKFINSAPVSFISILGHLSFITCTAAYRLYFLRDVFIPRSYIRFLKLKAAINHHIFGNE